MENFEFKAESRRLLELMIHSIYSEKEIFLRELISNASDALDKRYFLSLDGKGEPVSRQELEIRLALDKPNRTLSITDNGIGMNKEDLQNNLGTIAESGSRRFREAVERAKEAKEDGIDIIGQFGVGFYSAFMVADRITVITKKVGEDQAWRFTSEGSDGYTIEPCEKASVGTIVRLHIREDGEEKDEFSRYMREYPIYKLVKKYSDYIRYPIRMLMPHPQRKAGSTDENPEYEEVFEYETFNSMVPIWQRSRSEVTREEQEAFYSEHFADPEKPRRVISVNAEGDICYRALLYIPSHRPKDYDTDEYREGLELYSSGVMIMKDCRELLAPEFSFIRGVVDSPDISLNISRELLQHDRGLRLAARGIAKKIAGELRRMLANEREEYEAFFEDFGHTIKVSAMDDYAKKRDELGDLLLFYSVKKERSVTLAEYIADMKEEQKYIYFAPGRNLESILRMPQLETVRDHDMDVLAFTDQVDEFMADLFGVYREKQFRSITNDDLGLGETFSEENGKRFRELMEFVKETLGDRVTDVKASARLRSHPVCLSSGNGITLEMERLMRSFDKKAPVSAQLILELNTGHEAIHKLEIARVTDPDRARAYCEILFNQAKLIAGLAIDDPTGYTDLICSLWQ